MAICHYFKIVQMDVLMVVYFLNSLKSNQSYSIDSSKFPFGQFHSHDHTPFKCSVRTSSDFRCRAQKVVR